eukprot:3808718-Amphidinium_carterae.1
MHVSGTLARHGLKNSQHTRKFWLDCQARSAAKAATVEAQIRARCTSHSRVGHVSNMHYEFTPFGDIDKAAQCHMFARTQSESFHST